MTAQRDHARAAAAHRAHAPQLIARPDVTGAGVGLRRRDGALTEERVMKVYVTHKRPLNELRAGTALPRTIATEVGEATIDVEEMPVPKIPPMHPPARGVATGLAEARLRVPRRPAVGGSSIAHHLFPVGTIALGVTDLLTGAPCVLSCNHVLALLDHALAGDPVLQPSFADGGALPISAIGQVLRWTNVRFGGPPNRADAAIAACPPGIAVSYVDGIGPIEAIAPAVELGETMRKVGRATGLTSGRVATVSGTFKGNYALLGFGNTPALFVDQIVVDMECGYGDSGSLLVDSQNRAAGLLFAATDRRHTWFNPFNAVAAALNIGLMPRAT
jgi:hypothetical protein